MRYSQLFVQVAQMAETDPGHAAAMLRHAESVAMQSWPADLILCARCWQDYLHDLDNAMRCLLEAECRSQGSGAFVILAEAHLNFFNNPVLAERCYKKALALAKSTEEHERIREFLLAYAPNQATEYLQLSDDKMEKP